MEFGVAKGVEVARELQTSITEWNVGSVGESPTVEAATIGLDVVAVEELKEV